MQKKPILAACLSFLVVGMGQVYNGQVTKGLVLLAGSVISGFLTSLLIGFILLPIIWLYGIYDAFKVADNDLNKPRRVQ